MRPTLEVNYSGKQNFRQIVNVDEIFDENVNPHLPLQFRQFSLNSNLNSMFDHFNGIRLDQKEKIAFEDESCVKNIAIMPAYNEECTIAKMIIGCKKYVDLVVVVDDGSTDATAEIAENMGALLVKHEQNQGYGAAIKNCFETARKLNVEKMVILDSDGQHDSDEIPKMLASLNEDIDMVIGSRFLNKQGKNVPAYRKCGMNILDAATNFAGGINVSDTQSGFRAYGKKAIEKIRINDTDMSAGSEILMQINENGLNFKEEEIHCNYDLEKTSSQHPVIHGLNVLIQIIKQIEFRKPFYYYSVPGLILIVIGVGMEIYFYQMAKEGVQLPLMLMLFIRAAMPIGMLATFSGLILHSLSKMLLANKL